MEEHMKYFLSLCLLFLVMSSCKQETFYDKVIVCPGDRNVKSLDVNNGFKKLKLGHHISAFDNIIHKGSSTGVSGYTVYQVKPDAWAIFNLDEIEVKSIEAQFLNHLLCRFKLEFEGENNSFPFFLLLLEANGGASPEDTYPEVYVWNGKRVRLTYTVGPGRNATAEFTSAAVQKAMAAVGGDRWAETIRLNPEPPQDALVTLGCGIQQYVPPI
jgi:hypothetical protein